jgi:hypothetical protein
MPVLLRDILASDLDRITAIYRESVLNGVASYEIAPPDRSDEMAAARLSAITDQGYPYIAAIGEDGTPARLCLRLGLPHAAGLSLDGRGFDLSGTGARGKGIGKAAAERTDRHAARRSASARWWPSSAAPIRPRSRCTPHSASTRSAA